MDVAGGRRSVLVTGAASDAGKSLAQQLMSRGMRVYCADLLPMDVPGASCHQIEELSGFLPALARLVRDAHIGLVIPASSSVLWAMSSVQQAFGGQVDVVMPGSGPTATAQDRLLTAWGLWSRGVAVPEFGVPSDFAAGSAMPSVTAAPLVVRSRWTDRGDRPAIIVADPDLIDWTSLGDEVLVQELIGGPAYKAVVYRPQQGNDRLTAVLEETISADGGTVGMRVLGSGAAPDIERLAQAAVRAIGLTGVAEVSLRRPADGEACVLGLRAGFGPHGHLVPELLDVILRDHPPRQRGGSLHGRTAQRPGEGCVGGLRHVAVAGVQL